MNEPAPSATQPVAAPAPTVAQRLVGVALRIFIVCVIGFGLLAVYAVVTKKSPNAGGNTRAGATATLTKQEWKEKVSKSFDEKVSMLSSGVISCNAKDFYRIMGKPDSTQALGDKAMLYYQCTDGKIQLVCWKHNLEQDGELATTDINEY